jgi:phenylacetate-CoA ligase
MGRADQTAKVRGMFVHPAQVAELMKRHREIAKARLVITSANHQDVMTLHCEIAKPQPEALATAIESSIRDLCKLRGDVVFDAPGSLANDGKIIDDLRSYE